jgi:hypothetical protein
MLTGRQWPTFLTTLAFGIYFGHTSVGQWCMGRIDWVFAQINSWLS